MKNWQKGLFIVLIMAIYACSGGDSGTTEPLIKATGIPAIDQISEQIAKEPNRPDLYALRGQAHYDNELYAQAAADAERAIQLDTTNPQYYRQLANAYFDNNQSLPAIKTVQKAIDKFPDSILFYLMAAEMQVVTEQYNEALIVTDKLLKIQPYNAHALFMRGQVLKYMGDTLQAMMHYQRAVEQDADHLDSYLQLGILAGKMQHPLALQYLDNALRIDTANLTALMNKAWFYHDQRKYPDALVWYERAILNHPQDPEPSYNLGLMFMDMGDAAKKGSPEARSHYEKAFKNFDNATKFEVTFGEAYYYRGLAQECLGNREAAWKDYDQALVFEALLKGVSPEQVRAAMQRVK